MSSREGKRPHDVIIVLLTVAVALIVAWTLWSAFDFYSEPLDLRTLHPDYRRFRPAGEVGHGLGLIGSAMVLLLLLYSVRKRMHRLHRLGGLRTWLRYHIFLGVAGPVLITLHTSFKIDGLVSLSYWSMVAVALSGVFGRYLYQQLPRNVLGEELGPDLVQARREEIVVTLSQNPEFDDQALDAMEDLALSSLRGRSAPIALVRLPLLNAALAQYMRKLPLNLGDKEFSLIREWVLLTRRLHLFDTVRDLFHWWHVFHKPFAIVMILVMLIHVGVTVALGYTWIW